jgi:glycosyltransferase involved in cell wall biosynthesis
MMTSSEPDVFKLTIVLSGSGQTGGGFHQAVTNLRMLVSRLPENITLRVLDTKGAFRAELEDLVMQEVLAPEDLLEVPSKFSHLNDRVVTSGSFIYRVARWILKLQGKLVGASPVARFLDTSDADLIYFPSPSPIAIELQRKPFIWTLWDICHLDSPEFPEVRTSRKFEDREQFISLGLRKSVLTVVDSQELLRNIRTAYGIHRNKFVVIPFTPPGQISEAPETIPHLPPSLATLEAPFFFYPAQLWTHKNHVRIAEAIALLKTQSFEVHAAFAGRDHGAGAAVRRVIDQLGVSDQIHFLDYVEDAMIPLLYRKSAGLLMPTYFGPTNIPPLEAFAMDVPVAASNLHREQLGEAALYFDPDDSSELAEVMKEILSNRVRQKLISRGRTKLDEIFLHRIAGEDALLDQLERLSRRILR